MDNFENDLKVGKLMENYILNRFRKKFPNCEIKEGKYSGYDMHLNNGTDQTVEVKQDFRCITTRNIGAEIIMNGKPSALLLTEAFLWIIVTGYMIYYVDPKKIWKCILDNNLKPRSINPDGDNNKIKWIYLINEDLFSNYVEKYMVLTTDNPEYVINFVKETYKTHNYSYLRNFNGLEEIWNIV